MASMIPTRKVGSGGIAGAIATIIIKLSSDLLGYEIDGEYAAAITTLVMFAVAYYIPEKVDAA